MKEHEYMGMSESGFYTLADFTNTISKLRYGVEEHAKIIYREIYGHKCGINKLA